MGKAVKLPVVNPYKTAEISINNETGGNIKEILYSSSEQYISYTVMNGICMVDFSFCIKANCSTSNDSSSTGTSNAIWVTLDEKLPKPCITARGQSTSVNGDSGIANIRIDDDGTTKILINNYNSDVFNYFQNSFCYLAAE